MTDTAPAAALITSQAAEIERLREAALRVLAWVAPIAGDNMDEANARKEIESVQALVALVGPVTTGAAHVRVD